MERHTNKKCLTLGKIKNPICLLYGIYIIFKMVCHYWKFSPKMMVLLKNNKIYYTKLNQNVASNTPYFLLIIITITIIQH